MCTFCTRPLNDYNHAWVSWPAGFIIKNIPAAAVVPEQSWGPVCLCSMYSICCLYLNKCVFTAPRVGRNVDKQEHRGFLPRQLSTGTFNLQYTECQKTNGLNSVKRIKMMCYTVLNGNHVLLERNRLYYRDRIKNVIIFCV